VSEKKDRKPFFEALISKTDGIDILAEISGLKVDEKPKEKEKEPKDTFSGMLQSIPMLLLLPAIMPLMQQAFSQTLSSTTVNVKVESSASIIPIDISASTAIVPIEIKASTVTLNVSITASEITIPVKIESSATVLDVKITAATARVGINIQAQDIDVKLTGVFQAYQGFEKVIRGTSWVSIFDTYVINYTVPSNKRLVVMSISVKILPYRITVPFNMSKRYTNWYPDIYVTTGDDIIVEILRNTVTVSTMVVSYTNPEFHKEFPVPIIISRNDALIVSCHTKNTTSYVSVEVHCIEEVIE